MMTPKEDFMELVNRVDSLNEMKVNRDDLGQLLEPGFIDKFLEEQANLRIDVEELKQKVSSIDENLTDLIKRIDEEILKSIEKSFADVNSHIETMKAKLDTLDADDINDSFVRLEEQADSIMKELEDLKTSTDQFEKEAKSNFKKIAEMTSMLERLESTKVDRSKMYELLEMKADVELVSSKLDRSEFVSVVKDIKGDLERLTIVVKINEEEMNDGFRKTRHELSLKMYTEDFITATEPIRHRIKAIIYEQKKIKEIALTHLFPDAPGIVKCFSCKRGANLAGTKYPIINDIISQEKVGLLENDKPLELPPVDLDKPPIPPPDKPRIQDAAFLPVLFASARPQIGLVHQKRRSEIDNELEAYFSSKKLRSVDGEHTKTKPQQRGLSYAAVKLPYDKRCDVLLQGFDKRYYKGSLFNEKESNSHPFTESDAENKSSSSVNSSRNSLHPTPVVLQTASKGNNS